MEASFFFKKKRRVESPHSHLRRGTTDIAILHLDKNKKKKRGAARDQRICSSLFFFYFSFIIIVGLHERRVKLFLTLARDFSSTVNLSKIVAHLFKFQGYFI